MICIIMADGKAKRMSGLSKKKQLIEIDGEKIIDRTVRQLRALGIEPVIATHFVKNIIKKRMKFYLYGATLILKIVI